MRGLLALAGRADGAAGRGRRWRSTSTGSGRRTRASARAPSNYGPTTPSWPTAWSTRRSTDIWLAATRRPILDLRVALALLAVHEGFSGFIMTGEAADFVASVMAPHTLAICDAGNLVDERNQFVQEMAKEMSYWAAWPLLTVESLPPLEPPETPSCVACSTCSAPCRSAPGHMRSTPSVT